MAFVENLAPFFDADTGFGVTATLTPSGGGAASAAVVLFDAEAEVFDGEAIAVATTITLPAAEWPAVREGDVVTLAAASYRVRQVRLIDDGALKRLIVARV